MMILKNFCSMMTFQNIYYLMSEWNSSHLRLQGNFTTDMPGMQGLVQELDRPMMQTGTYTATGKAPTRAKLRKLIGREIKPQTDVVVQLVSE
jgi:hypothetical protein